MVLEAYHGLGLCHGIQIGYNFAHESVDQRLDVVEVLLCVTIQQVVGILRRVKRVLRRAVKR